MTKVIVFDFDGVIINSNPIKYSAFFQIFPSKKIIKRIVEQVLADHREKSRFYIIGEILSRLKKEKQIEFNDLNQQIGFYAKKYNDIVEEGAAKCNEVRGAKESLGVLSNKYQLYICSGTPLESLKRIIQRRSLRALFKDIYGGPKSKIENLADILKKEKIKGSEAMVVGDGQSDWEAAQKFGCKFIGLRNAFNDFAGRNFETLNNLENLPNLINRVKVGQKTANLKDVKPE